MVTIIKKGHIKSFGEVNLIVRDIREQARKAGDSRVDSGVGT